MLRHKHIEASRELRLWIGQVIVPAIVFAGTVIITNPAVKDKAIVWWESIITFLRKKFKKQKLDFVRCERCGQDIPILNDRYIQHHFCDLKPEA